jgi:hypothetical protein
MPLLGLGDCLLVMCSVHQPANIATLSGDTTMIFEIDIPDELVPGVVAAAYAAEQSARGRGGRSTPSPWPPKPAQDLKVGPYYLGPIPPQFNADGTPYATEEPEE